MSRLRRLAIALVATVTVTISGSITVVPTATAMPKLTCEENFERAVYYWHLGWQFYALGAFADAYQNWHISENYKRSSC